MKRNKMGVMFIVTALALAGVGITYAGWTDTITVSGTVDTGDVDFNLVSYSGTWAYKVDGHDIDLLENQYPGTPVVPTPDGAIVPGSGHDDNDWVAAAWAEPTTDDTGAIVDDSVTITFDNLFPCQDFVADFIVHYEGSIPARVAGDHYISVGDDVTNGEFWPVNGGVTESGATNWMEDLWAYHADNPGFGIWIEAHETEPITNGDVITGWEEDGAAIDQGHQVHYCDYMWFKVYIHIPQMNEFQGCSGSFTMDLYAMQWDVYDAEIDDLIYPTT